MSRDDKWGTRWRETPNYIELYVCETQFFARATRSIQTGGWDAQSERGDTTGGGGTREWVMTQMKEWLRCAAAGGELRSSYERYQQRRVQAVGQG